MAAADERWMRRALGPAELRVFGERHSDIGDELPCLSGDRTLAELPASDAILTFYPQEP